MLDRLTLSYKIKGALQVLQRQKWGPEIFQYQSTGWTPVYTEHKEAES